MRAARERVDAPGVGVDGNDIEVSVDDEGRKFGVATRDARDDGCATRLGVDVGNVEAHRSEVIADIVSGFGLGVRDAVAPVRCVEPDEVAGDARRLGQVGVVLGHASTVAFLSNNECWYGGVSLQQCDSRAGGGMADALA